MLPMPYDELARPLSAGGSVVGAAELHGCLSGALCAQAAVTPPEWAAEALPGHEDAAQLAALQAVLGDLIGQTRELLRDGDMGFAPLLPPDEAGLEERVAALAAWCSGFLYGLGRCGSLGQPGGEVGEILDDLGEIARAAVGGGDVSEAAERDYAELVEFVRAAVQLAYEELAPLRAASAAPAGGAGHGETT